MADELKNMSLETLLIHADRGCNDAGAAQRHVGHFRDTGHGFFGAGREGGEQWECVFDSLPPIHNVKVAVV